MGLGLALASTRSSTPTPQIPLSKSNKSSTPITESSQHKNPERIEPEPSSQIPIQPVSESVPTQLQNKPIEPQLPLVSPKLDNHQAEKTQRRSSKKN